MSDCKNCKHETHEIVKRDPIPYEFASAQEARHVRTINRFIIALSVMGFLLAGCVGMCFKINHDNVEKIESINKYWIDYISDYDFETYTEQYEYSQDGQGVNIIGDNNGVDFDGATPESDEENKNP